MHPVKCPHCLQVWYAEDDSERDDQLCEVCERNERLERGPEPYKLDRFTNVLALFLGIDLLLFALTALWPRPMGLVMLIYGSILACGGFIGFRMVSPNQHIKHTDWGMARWPIMFALHGLACVLAYFSFGAHRA